ncbi:MAG: hypothetical protein MK105_02350 [Crocinitomicaceae bacterium]|nr:hypothetical protein [Crocinitomicaceae bacterium]
MNYIKLIIVVIPLIFFSCESDNFRVVFYRAGFDSQNLDINVSINGIEKELILKKSVNPNVFEEVYFPLEKNVKKINLKLFISEENFDYSKEFDFKNNTSLHINFYTYQDSLQVSTGMIDNDVPIE